VFGKGLREFGTILFFRVRGEEVCVPEEMTMTLQNVMRQQQQQQQQGLTMFARDPVKLDPTEHFAHVLTPPSDSMFTGVVDACVDEEVLLGAAHQEYKSGNYKQALQHCSLVHERNPQRTDALLLLGAIYYQLHDFDMCIVKNEEAIRIEPQFAECYGNMANALKEKGNIDLAIQYYTVAIELKPNFCDAWSNLASAYMRKGRLQEAAECCRHALMLNPRLVSFLCLCKIVSRILLKNGCGLVPVHE
jgi:protein O-GlcNAc transferase